MARVFKNRPTNGVVVKEETLKTIIVSRTKFTLSCRGGILFGLYAFYAIYTSHSNRRHRSIKT